MDDFSITVGTVTNPLNLYMANSTFDEFKKALSESLKTMPEDQKKMMYKYYKKEKHLKTAYETGKKVSNSIINASNIKIEEIYKEFKNSINSKKDDW